MHPPLLLANNPDGSIPLGPYHDVPVALKVSGCSRLASKWVRPSKSIATLKGVSRGSLRAKFINLTIARDVASTSDEYRCKNVRGLADEATFPGDADSRQRIITGDHPTSEMGRS